MSVLTLADAAPPAAAVLAKAPGPISTMIWSLDVLAPHAVSEGSWWLIRTSAEAVADGLLEPAHDGLVRRRDTGDHKSSVSGALHVMVRCVLGSSAVELP